jgi:acyl-CoA thioester hydrolase
MGFRKFEKLFPYDQNDKKTPLTAECFHRVRQDEVDALGYVWCGSYAGYFEQGRDEWGKKFGFHFQDTVDNGFIMPVVQSYVDYYLPLRYDEKACIEIDCMWTEAAKMIFSYRVYNESRQLALQGYTIQVYTDLSGKLMVLRPEFAEKFFQQWDQNIEKSKWRSQNAVV